VGQIVSKIALVVFSIPSAILPLARLQVDGEKLQLENKILTVIRKDHRKTNLINLCGCSQHRQIGRTKLCNGYRLFRFRKNFNFNYSSVDMLHHSASPLIEKEGTPTCALLGRAASFRALSHTAFRKLSHVSSSPPKPCLLSIFCFGDVVGFDNTPFFTNTYTHSQLEANNPSLLLRGKTNN